MIIPFQGDVIGGAILQNDVADIVVTHIDNGGYAQDHGVLGGQMLAMLVAWAFWCPLNLAFTIVEVMAGRKMFFKAVMELNPAPVNFTCWAMTSYVNLCAWIKLILIMFSLISWIMLTGFVNFFLLIQISTSNTTQDDIRNTTLRF
jgi:hypothetical protein